MTTYYEKKLINTSNVFYPPTGIRLLKFVKDVYGKEIFKKLERRELTLSVDGEYKDPNDENFHDFRVNEDTTLYIFKDTPYNKISEDIFETELNTISKHVVPEIITSIKIDENNNDFTEHDKIQFDLLQLGSDMGFQPYVASNDRNKKIFATIPNLLKKIPKRFEICAKIKLIDVLWLKNNTVTHAFEVEHSTDVTRGILRMSDLIEEFPELNIPFYIVASSKRKDKVLREVNRIGFQYLKKSNRVRFISYENLRESIKIYKKMLKCMTSDFINEISESCILEKNEDFDEDENKDINDLLA